MIIQTVAGDNRTMAAEAAAAAGAVVGGINGIGIIPLGEGVGVRGIIGIGGRIGGRIGGCIDGDGRMKMKQSSMKHIRTIVK